MSSLIFAKSSSVAPPCDAFCRPRALRCGAGALPSRRRRMVHHRACVPQSRQPGPQARAEAAQTAMSCSCAAPTSPGRAAKCVLRSQPSPAAEPPQALAALAAGALLCTYGACCAAFFSLRRSDRASQAALACWPPSFPSRCRSPLRKQFSSCMLRAHASAAVTRRRSTSDPRSCG